METTLVLGSASPRRRELLALAGFSARVVPPVVDESATPGETSEHYLERIASAKFDDVARRVASEQIVLVADTIVELDGNILGKPEDDDEAIRVITALSGREHLVRTRFGLGKASSPEKAFFQTVTTQVCMRPLDTEEVRAYVATGEGRDKAGAYAIQGRASAFIASISGSYTNVVGLPTCEVSMALKRIR